MVDKTEMISAFADGEITQKEAEHLLTTLCSDPAQRARWQRYHLIGDALRKDLPTTLQTDLSKRVAESLAEEAVVFAPNHSPITPSQPRHHQNQRKYKTGLAIAASLAVVGFLSLFSMKEQLPDTIQVAQTHQQATSQNMVNATPLQTTSHVLLTAGSGQTLVIDRIEPNNPKLKSYILEHEYSSASTVRRGLPSGVRVVTFTNDR